MVTRGVERGSKNNRLPFCLFPLCPFSLLLLFLLPLQACSPDHPASSSQNVEPPTKYEGDESPQISRLIESGTLKLGRIAPVSEKVESAEPFGEIVTLGMKNETGEEQVFRVDCATVLRA